MIYRVVLTKNGEYKKTLHRCKTKETSFIHYHSLIDENQSVKFPKKFLNSKKIIPVKYEICVTKPTEPTDTFRILKDKYGRNYTEKPIGDWTILASADYNIEETFWLFGYDSRAKRPTIDDVVKKLFTGAHTRQMVKQIIVVYNKLLMYNEEQFDMVLCKCMDDAQRLHHTLAKVAKKQKIRSLMFMGTASPATVSLMYEVIKEKTNWPIEKIRRPSTRP